MAQKFVIGGQSRLSGEVEAGGAKNAAFPVLASSILTTEDVVISNLPLIEDVFRMVELLQGMGARVEWPERRTIRLNTAHLDPSRIDGATAARFRGSVVLLGPILARFGRVFVPTPGGDAIGERPIDTHLDAFLQLGAEVARKENGYELSLSNPPENPEVVLSEFSVTATANVMLFAARQNAPTTIKIADQDYQAQELAKVLGKMGAEVSIEGAHVIRVTGSSELRGFQHALMHDPTEAATFLLMGAVAAADSVLVKNCELRFLDLFLKRLGDFGVPLEIEKGEGGRGAVRVSRAENLRIPKVQTLIFPGLASDLQSLFGVLATQAAGSTLLHDALYEGRLKYLEELNKMGAEIFLTDPHRAIINGPTKLRGANLVTRDLRGGAALVTAAFIAEGQSTVSNVYQIDRGYERIEERLSALGADIERVD